MPGFISLVTMAETVWVLDRVYGLAGSEVAAAIERILQVETLIVQNSGKCSRRRLLLPQDMARLPMPSLARWADALDAPNAHFDKKALR